jgi:isoquinoline 1-oxidoreductase beta subunit
MELPAAALASRKGSGEVWGCFQSPQAARDLVAKRFGMPVENVTVVMTLLGGGFGRKSKPDYGAEAAKRPKRRMANWSGRLTRDDDLHNDYFHTVSAEHGLASIPRLPVAWL